MTDGQQIIDRSRTQWGKPYRFGAEVRVGLPWYFQAKAWDCCLTGDTLVHTADRGPVRIDAIAPGDVVWSWADGAMRSNKVAGVLEQPTQNVYRLRTRNRAIRASANHPFLVLRVGHDVADRGRRTWTPEWVRLDQIRRGDVIVTVDHLTVPDLERSLPAVGIPVDSDVAWLLGLFTGDGSLRADGFEICVYGAIRDRAAEILDRFGVPTTRTDKNGLVASSTRWREALIAVGFPPGTSSASKRVPPLIHDLGPVEQRAYLDGYGDADGHTDKRGYRAYHSCARDLVAEVRAVHIALGDNVSNLTETKRTKPIVIKGVEVADAQPLWAFQWYPVGRSGSWLLDRLGARTALPDRRFRAERVLGIDHVGVEPTWDLEIEDAHNFCADGILVHNSEFTEGTYGSFGIHLPDGSSVQAGFVKRISIADAERVPGALLGRYPKGGKPGHVVMSMGDGRTTSEAMGTAYGVRQGNIKGRGWQWAGIVPGCAYPRLGIHTPDSPPPPPPDGSWAQLQLAINWSKLYRLGNPTADLNENSPGAADAIRFAQAGVNNWYERFARLTKQQPPPPIPVNGQWDQLTRDRINFMQAIRDSVEPGRGHNELGTTGPNFWEAVYPTQP